MTNSVDGEVRVLYISGKSFDVLEKLAKEDEKTIKKLAEELIDTKDRERHIKIIPYEGEKRFKCTRKHCFEENKLPQPGEEEQL